MLRTDYTSLGLGQILCINSLSDGYEIWELKCYKLDMRFGISNLRSLYWTGSLVTVSNKLSKYKLDLVRVQVTWESGGTELA
jgi:hypothetical protein